MNMSATVEKEEKTAEPAAADKAKPDKASAKPDADKKPAAKPAKAEDGAKAADKPGAGAKGEKSKKEEVTATVKVLD